MRNELKKVLEKGDEIDNGKNPERISETWKAYSEFGQKYEKEINEILETDA